jgi:hypothetical protein
MKVYSGSAILTFRHHVTILLFSNYFITNITEKLHDLYTSPGIITTVKSRRIRWAGHVGRMGEKRNAYIEIAKI